MALTVPSHAACPVAQGFEAPRVQAMAPGLWRVPVRLSGSAGDVEVEVATLLLASDGPRLWLVGSGPTPAWGAALACAVRGVSGQTVTDVLNPRAHPETALANVAFAPARLWALADVAQAMARSCPTCLQRLKERLGPAGESLQPDTIRVPTRVLEAGRLGPFESVALARSPEARTLVLLHRAAGLVYAPGLVWPGAVPDLRDTDSAVLLDSLRTLQAALPDGAAVMGDAGLPGRAADIASHLAYIEALQSAVAAQVEAGQAEWAGGDSAELPAYAHLPGYAERHPLNRHRVWREAEARLFR